MKLQELLNVNEGNIICIANWCCRVVKNYTKLKLCTKHYERLKAYWDYNKSTRFDHRPAIIEWDIARIPLWINAKDWYAIVDKEFAWLDKYKRCLWTHWYAYNTKEGLLHHYIMNKVKWKHIDHIDWNRLNNIASNIRVIKFWENSFNQVRLRFDNTSWFAWVHYDKKVKKFQSFITYNKKKIHWWYFSDKSEAIKRRIELENIYYKWIKFI